MSQRVMRQHTNKAERGAQVQNQGAAAADAEGDGRTVNHSCRTLDHLPPTLPCRATIRPRPPGFFSSSRLPSPGDR
jgi:hypothetical protein